jgi:phosphoribosylformylglycinamidine (FGAM) synthase-like enzyme
MAPDHGTDPGVAGVGPWHRSKTSSSRSGSLPAYAVQHSIGFAADRVPGPPAARRASQPGGPALIHKFTVRPAPGCTPPELALIRDRLRLPDLQVWRDYYVDFETAPGPGQLAELAALLGDGVEWVAGIDERLAENCVQVAHRAGIVDNESDSIVTFCGYLGLRARAGKAATTYVSRSPHLADRVADRCVNPNIEEIHLDEPGYHTLTPAGRYLPPERFDLRGLDDRALAALGRSGGRNLSPEQMRHLRHVQATLRLDQVTDVLLEAVDARWSDHCSHTTWRSHGQLLKRLVAAAEATANPNIVSMFEDNAGVWEFYDGWSLAIKAETHNGPSAVSAYFGQLTKLGGVLRDILGTGLGADPIGCWEYTATGFPEEPAPLKGRPDPRHIALDTIQAIKEYGNTFGVPMMWSHLSFHRSYRAKPFALGGSVGTLPTACARRGAPAGGDLVVLIGGRTGNEGIHGASASSAGAVMDEAAVQIGAPLEQVKFRKAIVDLRDAGCLRAITDIGGAGLNSAVGEMGEACGVWINTALVPLKTSALPMWRILLSESQERMLLAVPPEQLEPTRRITNRHAVRATVIGRFVGTGRYTVFHDPALKEDAVVTAPAGAVPEHGGDSGFDCPYELLSWEPPQVCVEPVPAGDAVVSGFPALTAGALPALLERLVADVEVASQLYADRQYDSTVQGNTIYGPRYGDGDAVVASGYWAGGPIPGSPAAAVLSAAFDPWLYEVNPVLALRQMFCRLLTGQVLAGVRLGDICICDNFYTPHLAPHSGGWLVAMVEELAALVRHFGAPVISGKDSSAGSTMTDEGLVSVPPAVFLTALGKVPDRALLLPERWQLPGHLLVRVGPATGSTAGTVAARVLGLDAAALDGIDVAAHRRFLSALRAARGSFASGCLIGPGGLVARLFTSSLAAGLGVEVDCPGGGGDVSFLLAEHRCGAVVEMAEADLENLPAELEPVVLGRLTATPGIRIGEVEVPTSAVRKSWSTSFAERIV